MKLDLFPVLFTWANYRHIDGPINIIYLIQICLSQVNLSKPQILQLERLFIWINTYVIKLLLYDCTRTVGICYFQTFSKYFLKILIRYLPTSNQERVDALHIFKKSFRNMVLFANFHTRVITVNCSSAYLIASFRYIFALSSASAQG